MVPSNTREINYHPAYKALRLTKILFWPNSSLKKIGPGAFAMTGVEEFDAPESLVEIGDAAFYRCRKLKTVTLNQKLEKLGNMCFGSTSVQIKNTPV